MSSFRSGWRSKSAIDALNAVSDPTIRWLVRRFTREALRRLGDIPHSTLVLLAENGSCIELLDGIEVVLYRDDRASNGIDRDAGSGEEPTIEEASICFDLRPDGEGTGDRDPFVTGLVFAYPHQELLLAGLRLDQPACGPLGAKLPDESTDPNLHGRRQR